MATQDTQRSTSDWAVARLVSDGLSRFRQGWHDLPEGAAKRWLRFFIAGFVLVAVSMVVATLAVEALAPEGAWPWEKQLLGWIATQPPIVREAGIWFDALGNALIMWPLMALAAGMAAWRRRPLIALSIFPGYALVEVLVSVGWLLWARPHPEIMEASIGSAAFNPFPSGHTAHSTFAYGILIGLWWRASRSKLERLLAALLLVVLVGAASLSRLVVGAHWPTDVIAAWCLGAAWLGVQFKAITESERVEAGD